MLGYEVVAHNTATASLNRIHDDEVARRYGFSGGLVPGVDVYAYMTRVPAEAWGTDWLARGTMRARFLSPVYEGEAVRVVPGDPVDLAGGGHRRAGAAQRRGRDLRGRRGRPPGGSTGSASGPGAGRRGHLAGGGARRRAAGGGARSARARDPAGHRAPPVRGRPGGRVPGGGPRDASPLRRRPGGPPGLAAPRRQLRPVVERPARAVDPRRVGDRAPRHRGRRRHRRRPGHRHPGVGAQGSPPRRARRRPARPGRRRERGSERRERLVARVAHTAIYRPRAAVPSAP